MRNRFAANADERLDKLIADNTNLSRKRARSLIQRGGARVDGMVRTFPGHPVPAGALVELRTGAAPKKPKGGPGLVERWRGEGLVVVDKPSGLPSQPVRGGRAQHVYGMVSAAEGYAGLHHRLDRPASGLLLLTIEAGRNGTVAGWFQTGAVQRCYRVMVVGDPGENGIWEGVLDGRPARTRFVREATDGRMSALWVRLETGRTHQIRRHADAAGFPIVGDRRHGGAAGRLWPRLALHAAELRFPAEDGGTHTVRAPLPADLRALFAKVSAAGSAGDPEDPREAPAAPDALVS